MCSQVEVSVLGCPHVQSSPAECSVSEYDLEVSAVWRLRSTGGCCAKKTTIWIYFWCKDIVIGLVSRLWAAYPTDRDSVTVSGKNLPFTGYQVSFSWSENQPQLQANHSPPSSAGVKNDCICICVSALSKCHNGKQWRKCCLLFGVLCFTVYIVIQHCVVNTCRLLYYYYKIMAVLDSVDRGFAALLPRSGADKVTCIPEPLITFNPVNTKRILLYLKIQFVQRSKHFLSRL